MFSCNISPTRHLTGHNFILNSWFISIYFRALDAPALNGILVATYQMVMIFLFPAILMTSSYYKVTFNIPIKIIPIYLNWLIAMIGCNKLAFMYQMKDKSLTKIDQICLYFCKCLLSMSLNMLNSIRPNELNHLKFQNFY